MLLLPGYSPWDRKLRQDWATEHNLHMHWEIRKCGQLFLVQDSLIAVQFTSVAQLSPSHCDPMDCSTPGLPVHHQLPEFTQTHVIESVMPSNHLILCCPLLLSPSIFPSIRVFSNESVFHIRWPNIGVSTSTSVIQMNIQD